MKGSWPQADEKARTSQVWTPHPHPRLLPDISSAVTSPARKLQAVCVCGGVSICISLHSLLCDFRKGFSWIQQSWLLPAPGDFWDPIRENQEIVKLYPSARPQRTVHCTMMHLLQGYHAAVPKKGNKLALYLRDTLRGARGRAVCLTGSHLCLKSHRKTQRVSPTAVRETGHGSCRRGRECAGNPGTPAAERPFGNIRTLRPCSGVSY